MSNVVTLVRRELGQLFRSPLAYIFLVLYVVVVQLPYVMTVFLARTADLRGFFDWMPWCTVVFAALITMRAWAEERQENTYEMLLTFPMRDWELVLAKFLSTYLFLCVGIACTAALPVLVFQLGDPDPGPIVTGYLGAFLIAATWCSAGIFFSSLTRSQLAAGIVSMVLGLVSLFVGVGQVRAVLDGKVAGLGSLLGSVIGTWGHYDALGRGVLEVADVVFFVAWTAVFLYLNLLFVGMRRAPRAGTILTAGTILAIGCGLLGSRLVSDASIARADLAEEGLYTLSPGTVAVLQNADVPVRATLYVSPPDDMPGEMATLERDVVDRLAEMRLQSGGMIDLQVVHMEAANLVVAPEEEEKSDDELALDGDESIERRLAEQGVQPFPVQAYEATEVTSKYVYATLALTYREKDKELIHPLLPSRMPSFEHEVASTVARLVRDAPPRIALYVGEPPMDPQMKLFYQRQGIAIPQLYGQVAQLLRSEKFDVVETKLSQHSPMPESYDALVVIGPEGLSERAQWEINRALVSGRPVLLAVQRYTWDYQVRRNGIQPVREDADPGVDDLLEPLGVGVSRQILMQEDDAFSMRVPTGDQVRDMLSPLSLKLPMHVTLIGENLAEDSAITDRLTGALYLWGTALEIDRERLSKQGFDVTVLAETRDTAWQVSPAAPLRQADLSPAGQATGRFPVIAEIRGQFEDRFAGRERPKWPAALEMAPDGRPIPPPPDMPAGPLVPAPGKLIVTGSAHMWRDGALTSMDADALLLNCVSAMTLDENLLQVRSKEARQRTFGEPSETKAFFWTLVPLVIVPLLLVAVGCGIGFYRMRAREAWNREHGR